MRKSLSTVLFIVLTACQHVVAKAENATTAESANDFIDMIIPGQYIVYYKQNVDRNAAKQRLFSSASPFRIIRELRKAVAVAGINSAQYQKLLQDPAVAKVVQDITITIDSSRFLFETSQIDCSGYGVQAACSTVEITQNKPASWGLDRIDQVALPLDDMYTTKCDGTQVQVYILDTGIRKSHVEFQGGRAVCGVNFIADEDCQDYDGHGTHVAGIVGGSTYGVAKGVDLVDVKVFNKEGSGSLSAVLAGMDHVVIQKNKYPSTPMVINMSLGSGGTNVETKESIDEAVAAGIVVVVAAGNRGIDACNYSPAFVPSAITVGASDYTDQRPTWSNFGNCVDLYAPGVKILSSYGSGDSATALLSGTSMAAPHVAGAAALYLQANPSWTPAQVWQAMKNDAIGAIQGKLLLQTQYIE